MQDKNVKQINYPSCVSKIDCDCIYTDLNFNNEPVKARYSLVVEFNQLDYQSHKQIAPE